MRLLLAALAVSLLVVIPAAHAQRRRPRVIVLDDFGCNLARPRRPLDWVVAPIDPCPGATLLRLCGGRTSSGACTPIVDAATSLGDTALDRCTPDPALLSAAEALYGDYSPGSLESARRLYLVLARVPSLRAMALFRAGRAAFRASRYADAARAFGELLDSGVRGSLRDDVVLRYAAIITHDDHDEDQVPDPDFPHSTLGPAFLPDRPWAREVAVAALRMFVEETRFDPATTTLDVIKRRWPSAQTSDLDTLQADILERSNRHDELALHLFAAAQRCMTLETPCETAFLDRAQSRAVALLASCSPAPAGGDDASRARHCLEGITIGTRLTALRPSPLLSLDLADAAIWAGGTLARESARSASSARDPNIRARAAARFAAAPPPVPPALRSRPSPAAEPPSEGDFDSNAVYRVVSSDALRACAPRGGTVIGIRLQVALDGAVAVVAATPSGRVAECVSHVFRGVRAPAPEGGAAHIDGLVLFAPTAR